MKRFISEEQKRHEKHFNIQKHRNERRNQLKKKHSSICALEMATGVFKPMYIDEFEETSNKINTKMKFGFVKERKYYDNNMISRLKSAKDVIVNNHRNILRIIFMNTKNSEV